MSTQIQPAGTGADDATIGSVAWTNPGNITADDASYAQANLAGAGEKEHSVKLVKGGTISGNDKSTNALLSSTEGFVGYNFAVPADITLSDTDVNASNFGFVISYEESSIGTPFSHYLKGTNFSFSMPLGATINNIFLEVKAKDVTGVANVNFARITVTFTDNSGQVTQQVRMAKVIGWY